MNKRDERILVGDDSAEVREWMVLILEKAGYTVATASDGEEAFERIRRRRPDLVIADVVMPRRDGLDLLLKVRSGLPPPVPPVILCSGFDLTEEEPLRGGAAHFLRNGGGIHRLVIEKRMGELGPLQECDVDA